MAKRKDKKSRDKRRAALHAAREREINVISPEALRKIWEDSRHEDHFVEIHWHDEVGQEITTWDGFWGWYTRDPNKVSTAIRRQMKGEMGKLASMQRENRRETIRKRQEIDRAEAILDSARGARRAMEADDDLWALAAYSYAYRYGDEPKVDSDSREAARRIESVSDDLISDGLIEMTGDEPLSGIHDLRNRSFEITKAGREVVIGGRVRWLEEADDKVKALLRLHLGLDPNDNMAAAGVERALNDLRMRRLIDAPETVAEGVISLSGVKGDVSSFNAEKVALTEAGLQYLTDWQREGIAKLRLGETIRIVASDGRQRDVTLTQPGMVEELNRLQRAEGIPPQQAMLRVLKASSWPLDDAEVHPTDAMWLSSATLQTFSRLAREENLPGALTDEEVAGLYRNGRHIVWQSELTQTDEGHHYISADMLLIDDDHPEPVSRTIALPRRQFGLYVEGLEEVAHDERGDDMPAHVGSRSFEPIWKRHTELAQVGQRLDDYWTEVVDRGMREPPDPLPDTMHMSMQTRAATAQARLAALRKASVVTVDLDIMEGLPEWESPEEAWEYARDARAPYESMFFDFTGAGGYCPVIQGPSATSGKSYEFTLRGAFVWSTEGGLVIAPYAWFAPEEGGSDPRDLGNRCDYDIAGTMIYDDRFSATMSDPVQHLRQPRGKLSGPVLRVAAAALYDGKSGSIDVPEEFHYNPDYENDEIARAHAHVVAMAATKVLSVLYALDSTVNIDLEPSTPDREGERKLKRAEKRGWEVQIAETVRIHQTRYTERERNGEPEKRHFSHAFWRRGGYMFFPLGTRMADSLQEADPRKLVEHPAKGLCRKVYRPPTIVGLHDEHGNERKVVRKSYVWKDKK